MKSYDDEDGGGRKHIKSNMVECFELIMQSLYVLQWYFNLFQIYKKNSNDDGSKIGGLDFINFI